MHPIRRRPGLLVALCAALLVAGASTILRADEDAPGQSDGAAARDDIFPLASVRPGLRGHGLTVMAGTRVERFEIEVIDVIRNYLPKQDVILVRCLGEAFADHQIAQGMSGSPVYFDGRIAGALAYTWPWAKHPLGGVTPIEVMLAEGQRPREGRATGMAPPTRLRRASAARPASTDLVPIGTPLAVSGFSEAGRRALQDALGATRFTVCGGTAVGAPASAAKWVNLDAPLEPGCAIVVDLMRGDYAMSALGTCTFVDGERVHAFGHDFSGLGETLFPMSVGYVYTTVASRQIAFKIGGSIRQVGAVVQDRPSGIVGIRGEAARMVPITARFTNAVTKRTEKFQFEVCPNRVFFTQLVIGALREAFNTAEATLGANTKRYRMTVKIKDMEPWSYEDVIAGFDGGFQRVMIGLLDRPLNHSTQRPEFESFDLDVTIEHTDRRAYLRAATASADEARPGEELDVFLRLEKKEGGDPVRETLRVRIPHDAPAGDYQLTVIGGDYVDPEVAAPVDIADMPRMYEAFYKSTELVALLPTGRVDLDLDGTLLRNLPLSSLPRLVRSPGGRDAKLRPVTEKVRLEVPYVVSGSRTVSLRVVR